MSVSPGRMSLAPTGAEDDGGSGTKSVPAMLRLVKDCLVRHTQCVTDTVSAVADKEALSSLGTISHASAFVGGFQYSPFNAS